MKLILGDENKIWHETPDTHVQSFQGMLPMLNTLKIPGSVVILQLGNKQGAKSETWEGGHEIEI